MLKNTTRPEERRTHNRQLNNTPDRVPEENRNKNTQNNKNCNDNIPMISHNK